jgi:hypothetical protein
MDATPAEDDWGSMEATPAGATTSDSRGSLRDPQAPGRINEGGWGCMDATPADPATSDSRGSLRDPQAPVVRMTLLTPTAARKKTF